MEESSISIINKNNGQLTGESVKRYENQQSTIYST